jgi:hypothetical protein
MTTTEIATAIVRSSTCDFPPPTMDSGPCRKVAPRIHLASDGTYLTVTTNLINGSSLATILGYVCDYMNTSYCPTPQSTASKCNEARAAALQYDGQEGIDVWNNIMASCN